MTPHPWIQVPVWTALPLMTLINQSVPMVQTAIGQCRVINSDKGFVKLNYSAIVVLVLEACIIMLDACDTTKCPD